eukprot:c7825_g1_i1.p1 GENE.c7825_g1_i1~~c7825_g1_i1.p1  ORF type:complete len:416 (+),score=60.38 c7825_g1_i1:43-1290(+)
MKKSRIGKPRKNQPSRNGSNVKQTLANLTYVDAFPYRPQYEFNGFRSAFGAICTIIFLFAVILNIVDQIHSYETSPPLVKNSLYQIEDYRDEKIIPFPTIGVMFRLPGGVDFYDERFFRVEYQQGESFKGGFPIFSDAGRQKCTLTEPNGHFVYPNVHCPISDLSLQGADHLPNYRFVRVIIEQCINWTAWNGINAYIPAYGSTTNTSTFCASPESIEKVFKEGIFTVFFEESDIRTDTIDTRLFGYLRKLIKVAMPNLYFNEHYRVQLKKVNTDRRYVLDRSKTRSNFLSLSSSDTSFGDLDATILSCNSGQAECDREPHKFRMSFTFSLDYVFQRSHRSPVPLYDMFMNFGGVTFFFLVVFGGAATYANKYTFQKQTKGLDLRKLDNSQFDKFGNLVDKSFQMPRELQDMSAE